MKIFTAKQLSEADKSTVKNQDITSWELMERAASKAFEEIKAKLEDRKTKDIAVFCGIGNNGGDGLVIARKLAELGYVPKVFIVDYSDAHSDDFEENLKRLKKILKEEIVTINKGYGFPALNKDSMVIDAVFGIGLNRPLLDWVNALVKHINATKCFVVAIDMPTGMFSDRIPGEGQHILKADLTLTFQSPKLIFYLPQTAELTGEVSVIDIGLDENYLRETHAEAKLVDKEDILPLHKTRKKFTHKGTYGHCLVVGGSYGKIGSVVLASEAGLRIGAGKVTAVVPKCGYEILQTSVPEAMVQTTDDCNMLTNFERPNFKTDAVCFGMGAGLDDETATYFEDLLKATKKPMLIDADGLNLLAKHKNLLKLIPQNSVLTPHPAELKRLIGEWSDDFDKIKKTKAFAQKYNVIVVMKGAVTLTISNQEIFINTTGNPGMATAGSGDVLSGVISGLLAQGYSPENAVILGVYLHGSSGDLVVKKSSAEALIASDLIHNFGDAFQHLKIDNKSH